MIERVLAHLAAPRRRRGGAVAGLPARRLRRRLSRRPVRRRAPRPTPSSPSRSTPPGAIRFAAARGGHRRDVPRRQRRRAHRPRRQRPDRVPPRARAPRPRSPSRRSTTRRAFGVVPTDDDGRVLAFVEKPPPGEAPTNLINAGTYVLEPSVLDRIPGGRRVSIERETFPALVADGPLYALAVRRLLARHRHAGDVPAGQPRRSCRTAPALGRRRGGTGRRSRRAEVDARGRLGAVRCAAWSTGASTAGRCSARRVGRPRRAWSRLGASAGRGASARARRRGSVVRPGASSATTAWPSAPSVAGASSGARVAGVGA